MKQYKKRSLSLLLSLFLVLAILPALAQSAAADTGGDIPGTSMKPWVNPFTDVKEDDWFFGDAAYVVQQGLFTDASDTTFAPNTPMTRWMLVKVLWRIAGSPEPQGDSTFTDLQQDGYRQAVQWAAEQKIVTGYGDGLFGPEDKVTREQTAAILLRYMHAMEMGYVVTLEYRFFADEDEIADWAKDAVQVMNKLGILNGKGGGIIDPKGSATRAEAAAMLHRLAERDPLR